MRPPSDTKTLWEQIEEFDAGSTFVPESVSAPRPIAAQALVGLSGVARADHTHAGVGMITDGTSIVRGDVTLETDDGITITFDEEDRKLTWSVDDDFLMADEDEDITGAWNFHADIAVTGIWPTQTSPTAEVPVYGSLDVQGTLYADVIEASSQSPSGYIAINSAIGSNLTIADGFSLVLSDTTAEDDGVILKGSNRFLHNFHHPTGGTAIPTGKNTFLGETAGNFTMGSTATSTFHASYNTGAGHGVLAALTTGFSDTAVGARALEAETTGDYDTAIGYACLSGAVGTSGNTAVGGGSMSNLVIGDYNTSVGYGSLLGLRLTVASDYNVALGYNAGRNYGSGSGIATTLNDCVFLGSDSRPAADNEENEIVIGYGSRGQGSNTTVIGNTSITDAYINGILHLPDGLVVDKIIPYSASPETDIVLGHNTYVDGELTVEAAANFVDVNVSGTLTLAGALTFDTFAGDLTVTGDVVVDKIRPYSSSPTVDIVLGHNTLVDGELTVDAALNMGAFIVDQTTTVGSETELGVFEGSTKLAVFGTGTYLVGVSSEAGQFRMKESSSHPGMGAAGGYGYLYTMADNKLYFTDGAGAQHEVQFV
uniref:Putative tail protein n=1 Tax=viral metagenome TaxID=1070528 RepID=A0A6M3XU03_9ZZZZ